LARWRLPGHPGKTAQRVLRRLHDLAGVVAPRVQAALLSTVFNRWTTKRRFQQDAAEGCLLRCGGADAIEHYLRCRVVRRFAAVRLGLHYEPDEAWELLLLAKCPWRASQSRDLWALVALLHYVVYRTTNALRRSDPLPEAEVHRAFQQALVEGTRGHDSSMRLVARAHVRALLPRQ